MRILLSLVCFLSLAHQSSAQVYVQEARYRNHLAAEKMKGAVRTVVETHYKQLPGTDLKGGTFYYYFVIEYNRAGNLTEKRQYREDSSLAHVDRYYYDAKGRPERHVSSSPGSRVSPESTKYYYYDERSNKIREELTIAPRKVIVVSRFAYDARNRMTAEVHDATPAGRDIRRTVYSYDVSGRKTQEVISEGSYTTRRQYHYRDSGRLEIHYWYRKGTGPEKHVIGEQRVDGDGNLLYAVYDLSDNTPPAPRYRYVFDKQRNWTLQLIDNLPAGARPGVSVSRIITYY